MNTPVFDPDDPRLTAYALGELSPAEREEVEQLLAASPEARAEVERTTALANALEDGYRHENEDYWEARAVVSPPPGKIVEFPSSRRAGTQRIVGLAWKIAAVLVALAALSPLALRRAPRMQTATRDTSRSSEANPASPAAAPPATEPTSTVGSVAKANGGRDQTSAAPAEPAAEPAKSDTDALVAMNEDRFQIDGSTPADAAGRRATPPVDSAAKPSALPAVAAAAPQAVAPGASETSSGGAAETTVDRIRRSLVCIRRTDGSMVAGVAVTSDGGILAAQPLPSEERRPMVVLADGRETVATVAGERAGLGLSRLHIEGATVPAVALATRLPVNNGSLTVASTDRRTGALRLIRAHGTVSGPEACLQWTDQPPSDDETSFVFNSDGELLNRIASSAAPKTASRTRSASDRTVPKEMYVRPFTSTECAVLQPPAKNAPH